MRNLARFLLFASAFVVARACPAAAADDVVSDCGDNGGPDQLRARVASANADETGDATITFSCGPATIVLEDSLSIEQPMTMDGDDSIRLSGGDSTRIFYVGSTLVLRDIRLSGDGGAFLNFAEGTFELRDSIARGNEAARNGGGIANEASFEVTGGAFVDNGAAAGAVFSTSTSRFHNVTFSRNDAGAGHAIWHSDGDLLLDRVTVVGADIGDGANLHVENPDSRILFNAAGDQHATDAMLGPLAGVGQNTSPNCPEPWDCREELL